MLETKTYQASAPRVIKNHPSENIGAFHDALASKVSATFSGVLARILFVTVPESSPKDFSINLAKAKRYPCFPPYGAGLLAKKLKDSGYSVLIANLNYIVLKKSIEDCNFEYIEA